MVDEQYDASKDSTESQRKGVVAGENRYKGFAIP